MFKTNNFLYFQKQRDPRLNEILYPFYDELRAREIIATYERNPELATQGNLLSCVIYCATLEVNTTLTP